MFAAHADVIFSIVCLQYERQIRAPIAKPTTAIII